MAENIAEFYADQLNIQNNHGVVLAKFFCELFEIPLEVEKIKTFNKLLKIYSKELVYFSIIDCFDIENVRLKNIYPLISYLCKKRLENKLSKSPNAINLTEQSDALSKKVEKSRHKKLKIKNPFEEGACERPV